MTWTAPTPAEVDGPVSGDERPIIEGYLSWQRSGTWPRSSAPGSGSGASGEPVGPTYDPDKGKDTDFEDVEPAHARHNGHADLLRERIDGGTGR